MTEHYLEIVGATGLRLNCLLVTSCRCTKNTRKSRLALWSYGLLTMALAGIKSSGHGFHQSVSGPTRNSNASDLVPTEFACIPAGWKPRSCPYTTATVLVMPEIEVVRRDQKTFSWHLPHLVRVDKKTASTKICNPFVSSTCQPISR